MPRDNNNSPDDENPSQLPSSGEGADSALDALKRKRREIPHTDTTFPSEPQPSPAPPKRS